MLKSRTYINMLKKKTTTTIVRHPSCNDNDSLATHQVNDLKL